MRYAWIESQRDNYSICLMCRVLEVSRSGFYEWRKRPPSEQAKRREQILHAAAASHAASGQIYGYRKVREDLLEQEIFCCLETVRRVMRSAGLSSKVKRSFVTPPTPGIRQPS